MITVWRGEDWAASRAGSVLQSDQLLAAGRQQASFDNARLFLLQAGAGKIRVLFDEFGRRRVLLALASIIRELQPEQQLVVREMLRSMGSGRLPTKPEREVVHVLAEALKDRLR